MRVFRIFWCLTLAASLPAVPGLHFFLPYLPENPVIVDAGAGDGGSSLGMASLWPNGTIYAFEPSPDLYLRLVDAVAPFPNIVPVAAALGDRDGSASFNVSKPIYEGEVWDGQGSLLMPHPEFWQWPIRFDPVEVEVRTLDSWAKERGVGKIDFLWLDLQGMEYQVLKASPEILKTVKVIQAEYSLRPFYEGTVLYPEFKTFMEENGFIEVAIDDQGGGGDAIFVRANRQTPFTWWPSSDDEP